MMEWSQFLSMLTVTVLGSGGVSGVIIFLWQKRIEAEYARELEDFKSKQNEKIEQLSKLLEKRNYISKVRFDAEFSIYRDLSGAIFDLVSAQGDLFTYNNWDSVPADEGERKKIYTERFEKARNAYNPAMIMLHRNAPFIAEGLYEECSAILRLCKNQLDFYPKFYIEDDYKENRRSDVFKECNTRTEEINAKLKELFVKIREYLKSLDVKE